MIIIKWKILKIIKRATFNINFIEQKKNIQFTRLKKKKRLAHIDQNDNNRRVKNIYFFMWLNRYIKAKNHL
jgi:hypothetical protein